MFTRRKLRVLVVDDDPNFADLLAVVLDGDPRLTVVGRAADGAEGVEAAMLLRPDVVVMDVDMPVLDGIEAAHRIRNRLRRTRVVLVSGSDDAVRRAAGVLRKGGDPQPIADAVATQKRVAFAATPAFAA